MTSLTASSPRAAPRWLFALALLWPHLDASATELELAWRVSVRAPLLSPVATGRGEVLIADATGMVRLLDAATGELRVEGRVGTRLADVAGDGVELAALSADGRILLLDRDDIVPVRELCLPAPASGPLRLADGLLLVPLEDATLVAIAPATGGQVWRAALMGPVRHRPAVGGDRVLVASPTGAVALLRLGDGRPIARSRVPAAAEMHTGFTDRLALVGGAGGRLHAFAAGDGDRAWRAEIGRGPSSAMVGSGRLVLVVTQANQAVLLEDNGTPRWRRGLAARVRHEPVIAADRAWLLPERLGRLVALELASGEEMATFRLPSPLDWAVSPPVWESDVLVVVTARGDVLGILPEPRAAPAPETLELPEPGEELVPPTTSGPDR